MFKLPTMIFFALFILSFLIWNKKIEDAFLMGLSENLLSGQFLELLLPYTLFTDSK